MTEAAREHPPRPDIAAGVLLVLGILAALVGLLAPAGAAGTGNDRNSVLVEGLVLSLFGCMLIAGCVVCRREAARVAEASAQPVRSGTPWDWTDIALAVPLFAVILSIVSIPFAFIPARDNALVQLLGTSLQYAAMVAALWLLVVTRRGSSWTALGWRRPRSMRWLLLAVPIAIAAIVGASLVGDALQAVFPNAKNPQCGAIQSGYGTSLLAFLVAVPAICIIAPAVEETVFRGFLFGWLRPNIGVWPGMVSSGLIFAAIHGIAIVLIPLALFGMLLAWVYARSDSVIPGVMVHGLFNFFNLIFIFIDKC